MALTKADRSLQPNFARSKRRAQAQPTNSGQGSSLKIPLVITLSCCRQTKLWNTMPYQPNATDLETNCTQTLVELLNLDFLDFFAGLQPLTWVLLGLSFFFHLTRPRHPWALAFRLWVLRLAAASCPCWLASRRFPLLVEGSRTLEVCVAWMEPFHTLTRWLIQESSWVSPKLLTGCFLISKRVSWLLSLSRARQQSRLC